MNYQIHLNRLTVFCDRLELDANVQYIVCYNDGNVVAFIPLLWYRFKYVDVIGNTLLYDIVEVI